MPRRRAPSPWRWPRPRLLAPGSFTSAMRTMAALAGETLGDRVAKSLRAAGDDRRLCWRANLVMIQQTSSVAPFPPRDPSGRFRAPHRFELIQRRQLEAAAGGIDEDLAGQEVLLDGADALDRAFEAGNRGDGQIGVELPATTLARTRCMSLSSEPLVPMK